MDKKCCVNIAIIIAILLAISIGLIAGAFESVSILRFGILFDSAKVQLINKDNYLYLSGRYHAGLGNNFIELPSKRVTLVFSNDATIKKSSDYSESSITTRTIEGIPLDTTVSCQIRLVDDKVLSIVDQARKDFNKKFVNTVRLLNLFDTKSYKPILATVMKSTILDVLSTYKLNQVFNERSISLFISTFIRYYRDTR